MEFSLFLSSRSVFFSPPLFALLTAFSSSPCHSTIYSFSLLISALLSLLYSLLSTLHLSSSLLLSCYIWKSSCFLDISSIVHMSIVCMQSPNIYLWYFALKKKYAAACLDLHVCVFQVFQEEMGVVKSYNLKPGGVKIPVTRQNRKGES